MKIKYEVLTDDCNCDTCGFSYATGARIFFDDKLVYELEPVAHCYDGVNMVNRNNQQCSVHEKIIELLEHEMEEIYE